MSVFFPEAKREFGEPIAHFTARVYLTHQREAMARKAARLATLSREHILTSRVDLEERTVEFTVLVRLPGEDEGPLGEPWVDP